MNFANARRLIALVTRNRPEERTTMLQLTDELEMFLRRQYPGHLCEDSNCPHHSYKHAFGGENHHLSRCKYCNHAHIHLSTHFFIDPPNRSHSRSLTHSLTHSCTLPLSRSLTHSLIRSLIHPPTLSLTHLSSHSLTHSLIYPLPPSRTLFCHGFLYCTISFPIFIIFIRK